jgi:hypothetical protein
LQGFLFAFGTFAMGTQIFSGVVHPPINHWSKQQQDGDRDLGLLFSFGDILGLFLNCKSTDFRFVEPIIGKSGLQKDFS